MLLSSLAACGQQINLSNPNQVKGMLPKSNGGTGTASPTLISGTCITITGSWPVQTVALQNGCGGGSSIGYPPAGVPQSTGSAWGASLTLGTAANNLVQLNGSAQLPAVSAANLTNFPTFNQNTTGTAANLSGTPALPNGTSATTQTLSDSSTTLATDAFVHNLVNSLVTGVSSVNTRTGPVTIIGSDIPNNSANTSGTAANLSGTPTLPNGTVLPGYVPNTVMVNGHALSSNVVISATDINTGTLPHAQLPALVSGDIPNNAANTSGTAGNLSGTPTLPNGVSGTTQSPGDNTNKLATDAFVIANASTGVQTFVGRNGTVLPLAPDYATVGVIQSNGGTGVLDFAIANTGTPANAPDITLNSTLGSINLGFGPVGSSTYAMSVTQNLITLSTFLQPLVTTSDPCCTQPMGLVWINPFALRSGTPHLKIWCSDHVCTTLTDADGPWDMANGVVGPVIRPDTNQPNQTVLAYGASLVSPFIDGATLRHPTFLNDTNDLMRMYNGTVNPTCTQVTANGQLAECKDPSTDALLLSYGDDFHPATRTIASGTAALSTVLVNNGTCGSVVTVAATDTLTTDVIEYTFNSTVAFNPGALRLVVWATADNVNFEYCNPTGGNVTPAAETINWKVIR